MKDTNAVIRRAKAFGYEIHQSLGGWTMLRDGKVFTFKNIQKVKDFLNNQVLR